MFLKSLFAFGDILVLFEIDLTVVLVMYLDLFYKAKFFEFSSIFGLKDKFFSLLFKQLIIILKSVPSKSLEVSHFLGTQF